MVTKISITEQCATKATKIIQILEIHTKMSCRYKVNLENNNVRTSKYDTTFCKTDDKTLGWNVAGFEYVTNFSSLPTQSIASVTFTFVSL